MGIKNIKTVDGVIKARYDQELDAWVCVKGEFEGHVYETYSCFEMYSLETIIEEVKENKEDLEEVSIQEIGICSDIEHYFTGDIEDMDEALHELTEDFLRLKRPSIATFRKHGFYYAGC